MATPPIVPVPSAPKQHVKLPRKTALHLEKTLKRVTDARTAARQWPYTFSKGDLIEMALVTLDYALDAEEKRVAAELARTKKSGAGKRGAR